MAPPSAGAFQPPSQGRARRLRALLSCAVLVALAVSAHREVRNTAVTISRLAAARIHNWQSYETAFSTPDTGRDGLPPGVTAAADALTGRHAAAFRMAPGFSADALLSQRMEEIAWPLEIDPHAAFVVRKTEEPTACALVSETDGVALDRCD